MPTTAAFATINPWCAVPVAVGAAIVGLSIAVGEELRKNECSFATTSQLVFIGFAGTFLGSLFLYDRLHPNVPSDDTIYETINSVCWSPDKILTVTTDGKQYAGKVDIVQESRISSSGPQASYKAVVTITRDEPDIFLGGDYQREKKLDSATRPGEWKPGMARESVGKNTYIDCTAG